MIVVLIAAVAIWAVFTLDAYLVTKAPRRRHFWLRPSKDEEDDLLYTPPRLWVHRARREVKDD